jgi:hypothetical protein
MNKLQKTSAYLKVKYGEDTSAYKKVLKKYALIIEDIYNFLWKVSQTCNQYINKETSKELRQADLHALISAKWVDKSFDLFSDKFKTIIASNQEDILVSELRLVSEKCNTMSFALKNLLKSSSSKDFVLKINKIISLVPEFSKAKSDIFEARVSQRLGNLSTDINNEIDIV